MHGDSFSHRGGGVQGHYDHQPPFDYGADDDPEGGRLEVENAIILVDFCLLALIVFPAKALFCRMDIEDYVDHDDSFHTFTEQELEEITRRIEEWYRSNRRRLPWRGDQPPYSKTAEVKTTAKRDSKQSSVTSFFAAKRKRVDPQPEEKKTYDFVKEGITGYSEFVSEIMLQQTRVDTVIDKYILWMERFPTIEALAAATEDDVNSLWSGLGYYRRAQYLLKGAKVILPALLSV